MRTAGLVVLVFLVVGCGSVQAGDQRGVPDGACCYTEGYLETAFAEGTEELWCGFYQGTWSGGTCYVNQNVCANVGGTWNGTLCYISAGMGCMVTYDAYCRLLPGADPKGPATECQAGGYCPGVPAVSTWGAGVMTLLVMCAGTVILHRRYTRSCTTSE